VPEAVLVARAVEHAKLTHDSIAVFASLAALVPMLQQIVAGADPNEAIKLAGSKLRMPKITGEELMVSYRAARGPGNIPKAEKWAQHMVFAEETVTEGCLRLMDKSPLDVCGGLAGNRLSTACYTEHGMAAGLLGSTDVNDLLLGRSPPQKHWTAQRHLISESHPCQHVSSLQFTA